MEILFSAEASASGSPVSLLPSSSASYSRVREMASCTSDAPMGARIEVRITPTTPTSPEDPSRSRSPPPKYMSEYPRYEITDAMAEAMAEVRMS